MVLPDHASLNLCILSKKAETFFCSVTKNTKDGKWELTVDRGINILMIIDISIDNKYINREFGKSRTIIGGTAYEPGKSSDFH